MLASFERTGLLFKWFYTFAKTLTQPLCTLAVNTQNTVRGTNVVGIKRVSYRHELVNRGDWSTGKKFRMGLDIFCDSRLAEYEQAAI